MNQELPAARALRCRFEKCGPIRYISHLDLTRAFHRAFARAGIPLKFSEGFSPHPKFAFALPLSVGTESVVELADFTLKPGFEMDTEALREALQAQMPAGIRLRSVTEQEEKFSRIAFATYRVRLPKMDPSGIPAAREALKGSLVIQKKNKKGKLVEKDISAGIRSFDFEPCEEGVVLNACLSAAGESYLKPETVLEVLSNRLGEAPFAERGILRTGVFFEDMTPFC
ncbi:MAG: TIGR03936 family radical SAM-associated protein [Clostridia bacterium]|nr:TIGR03936 family radical SAM-associated protein [Clostridia bacterium]